MPRRRGEGGIGVRRSFVMLPLTLLLCGRHLAAMTATSSTTPKLKFRSHSFPSIRVMRHGGSLGIGKSRGNTNLVTLAVAPVPPRIEEDRMKRKQSIPLHWNQPHDKKMGGESDKSGKDHHKTHVEEAKRLEYVHPPILSAYDRQITKVQAAAYGTSFSLITLLWCTITGNLQKLNLISTTERQVATIRFVSHLADKLLKIFPFLQVKVSGDENISASDRPSVWVANHVSELDLLVFLILEGRYDIGKNRPIKFLYWNELESYPILSHFLEASGMISVEMEDTGFEVDNQYKLRSLKNMYRAMDEAIQNGFDLAILPEGRRNQDAPVLAKAFPGAYKLAKKHDAMINFLGTHGIQDVWNMKDGYHTSSKEISVRFWPAMKFADKEHFIQCFYEYLGSW
eukprot:CAMPEP_0114487688 /NCGR_PEP_ID=MMETSP0109-20121206/911_1 /TAXON_ID=29199 /ORGANISM="Chlorarachnion reptans, Strain CCCM449" /LENGTH=397 /DNA_ID=CAMNT_0001663993 /DNA_START=261 /DNA_END=1451 /DNA_ORIENTATION=-